MNAEIAQIINKLETVKEKITRLQSYICETPTPKALELATEIIAQVKVPKEISSGSQEILKGYVAFQCNGSCPELSPNGRALIPKAYAEELEKADLGYIIRNP